LSGYREKGDGRKQRFAFKEKYYMPEEARWISLKISASGIRLISKKGLTTVLKEAKEKGYILNY
jgi:large subunit ribosomal protein L28